MDTTLRHISKWKREYAAIIHYIISIKNVYIHLMNIFAEQQRRDRCREQTYGHSCGGGRRGGMYRGSNMETHITICQIDSHGNSNQTSATT